ncbi:ABC transporter ATP-binding protein [Devosia sp. XK-2]|uniref:ABC transporter ATP-binding protein n=1 Tax=Devosia sp. XK-2 TaxID=3126689 RepID=UPI0030CB23DC
MRDVAPQERGDAAGPASGSAIHFDGVSKSFVLSGGEHVHAIDNVHLRVPANQFVAIVGPSGCGKSTLLRLADGLVAPDAGRVSIAGSAPKPGPGIGMMFQNFRLIPWRNVAGNVGFALESSGLRRAAIDEYVQKQLQQVGLARWSNHYPAQLSGGMKQRVALARALVGGPQIVLMDEPFASLDAQTRELMQDDLLALWDRQRPTIVFVTHSVDEALMLADRVLVMGGGRVLDDIMVGLPRPRIPTDAEQAGPYGQLRRHIWHRIRDLVMADPNSAFFGRTGSAPESGIR